MAGRKDQVPTYTVNIGFNHKPEVKRQMEALAEKQGRKPSALLREALDAYLGANPVEVPARKKRPVKRIQRAQF